MNWSHLCNFLFIVKINEQKREKEKNLVGKNELTAFIQTERVDIDITTIYKHYINRLF